MSTLTKNELIATSGGGLGKWAIAGLVVGAIFVVSVIYGFIHPNKCN